MSEVIVIKPPNIATALFKIIGDAPLVMRRFSLKTADGLADNQQGRNAKGKKKERVPQVPEDDFNQARYVSREGWDGFHAAALRCAMISACRLIGFKMTIAKMSVFIVADGVDAKEPQIPLIRIHGCEPVMQRDVCRVETGQPYINYRPAYHGWHAFVKVKWDRDQFSPNDIVALLSRVGMQVGIGEGRPDSKNSAGQGWGTFSLESMS